MTDAIPNRVQRFQAHEYGWHIRSDDIACKERLRITWYGLRGLVEQNGWKEAERIIAEYGHDFERYDKANAIPNSAADALPPRLTPHLTPGHLHEGPLPPRWKQRGMQVEPVEDADATRNRAAERFGQHQRREWTLLSCPECRALVLPEHEQEHREWHRG